MYITHFRLTNELDLAQTTSEEEKERYTYGYIVYQFNSINMFLYKREYYIFSPFIVPHCHRRWSAGDLEMSASVCTSIRYTRLKFLFKVFDALEICLD
jgi:hypothetical protein